MAFYTFELVLAGIILLTAMAFGGVHLWRKRRREALEKVDDSNTEYETEKTEK